MNVPSSEFRRDLPLPSVSDTERYRVLRLAKLIAAFAEGKLPGVGITHATTEMDDWRLISVNHQRLVMSAIKSLGSGIKVIEPLPMQAGSARTRTNLGPHLDALTRKYQNREGSGLTASWLLHTCIGPSADVRLISSRSGSYCFGETPIIGDANLTYEERANRGYDRDENDMLFYDRRWNKHEPDYPNILDQSFDPVISEPEVYHFEQTPMSSVLFALGTSFGPRTIHDFASLKPGQERQVGLNHMSIAAH